MKPLTRKEMLLDGVAKGNLDTFKPATREEVFAKRALANAGSSGGGSCTFLYDNESGYLYHDNSYTRKVTKSEFIEMVNKGQIWIYFDDGYNNGLVVSWYAGDDIEFAEVTYIDTTGKDLATRFVCTAEYVPSTEG